MSETKILSLPPAELVLAVERKAAAGEPFFDDACTLCLDVSETMDEARWFIGDMAVLICSDKRYGADQIGEFAKSIKISVERAKEYRLMATYYEKAARAELLHLPNLSYSHWRIAKQLKDHSGIQGSLTFLYACADGNWTIEQAIVEVNKILGKEPKTKEQAEPKPEPIAVFEGYVTKVDGNIVSLNVTSPKGLQPGVLYRVEVFDAAGE